MDRKESIWNVPNILTMIRIALIGVFIWLFFTGHRYWAMGVFLLAGFTDFLDGFIARKYNLVTSFGKLMDPLADKLMLITALSCLTIAQLVPVWLVVAVAVKELAMVLGGIWMLRHGIVVQAEMIGKTATVVFIIAVVATFLNEYTAPWDTYLQIIAVALSFAALIWYLVLAIRAMQKKKQA